MIKYLKIVIFVVCAICMACSTEDESETTSTITLSSEVVSASQTVVMATLNGAVGAEWSGEITDTEGFVSFSLLSSGVSSTEGVIGESGVKIVYIYISSNSSSEERSADVSISLAGTATKLFTITQQATTTDDSDDSTINQTWAELPVQTINDDYQYVVHYTTLNSESVRNFSMCYDKSKYAARWVAFPYHTVYDGSVGRNEEWTYDPQIETKYQPNLTSSYSSSNYDRGHQLASNDRQATISMNKQTFYYSNMTPQLSGLNQGTWSTFETKVRKQVCSDTLYVVTGADFTTTLGTTTDASNKACPIPRGYYKVLLRTITGNTGKAVSECSASELQAIGYWFDHQSYSSIPEPVSVAYIESLTGFTFFPTVPSSVKETFNKDFWSIND